MTIKGNKIELEVLELRNMMLEVATIAAKKAMASAGILSPYVSKAQAYKMYSRRLVDRWIKEGLIKEIKDGEYNMKIRISRIELETAAATSNRVSWYQSQSYELPDFPDSKETAL